MDNNKDFLLDLFFPKFCFGCQKEGVYLCDDCKATLDISEFQYCICNRKPVLLPAQAGLSPEHGKCDRCRDKKLSGLYFALPYSDKALAKKLIYQFKYQPYAKDLAKTLSGILIEHFIISGRNTEAVWQNSVLIPIPLDKKKLRSRGYNQSEELAKELSKIIHIPVITDDLIKTKATKPQMGLSKEQREKNLKGAFAIKNCAISEVPQFSGKKVFLVDDVYTTGSTMEECALVLRNSGAKQVWGIAIAREE